MAVPVPASTAILRLKDKYANGQAFCQANGFLVMKNADPADLNAQCYQPRAGVDFFDSDASAALTTSSTLFGFIFGLAMFMFTAWEQLQGIYSKPVNQAGRTNNQLAKQVSHCTWRWALTLCSILVCSLPLQVASNSSRDYPAVEYCPYMQNRAPRSKALTDHCPWYSSLACCNKKEAAIFAGSNEPLPGASPKCLAALDYHACWPCAPYQQCFYDRVNFRVTMCESWCDAIHSLCGTAQFRGQSVAARFAGGNAFCRAMHFDVPRWTLATISPSASCRQVTMA